MCADCGLPLVDRLSHEPPAQPSAGVSARPVVDGPLRRAAERPAGQPAELVTVFRASSPIESAIAESILRSAEVDFLSRGGYVQDLFGLGRFPRGMNLIVGPIEIQVRSEDAADATALLENVRTGVADSGTDEEWDQDAGQHGREAGSGPVDEGGALCQPSSPDLEESDVW